MSQNILCYAKREKWEHRKYWAKTNLKTSWGNSKVWISTTDVKALFRSPTPFSFVDCSTLLSLGLLPHPVSRFLRLVYHDSGIANIMGFPGFTLTASCNGLSGPSCRDVPDTHLASVMEGESITLFLYP